MTIDDVVSVLHACPSGTAARLEWTILLGVFETPFRKRYVHSTKKPAVSVPCPEKRPGCYQDVKFNTVSKEYRAVCSSEPEVCQRRTLSKSDVSCWAMAFGQFAGDIAGAVGAEVDCQEVGHRLWRCGVCRTGGGSVTVFFGTPETDGTWDVDPAVLGAYGDWLLVVPSVQRLAGRLVSSVQAAGGVLVSLGDCCRLADGHLVAGGTGKNARDYVLSAKAASAGDTVWSTETYTFDLNGKSAVAYGGRYYCGDGVTPRRVGVEYAGRVRLALEDSALQFNVIGKNPLTVANVLRVDSEGAETVVEFEGGDVRPIDCVTFPDLEGLEKDAVRAGKHRGPTQEIAVFRRLPLAKAENDFRRILLPKRKPLDLSRKSKCRPVLRAIWEYCKKTGKREFAYRDVQLDEQGEQRPGMPKSDRLRDDVFKDLKAECDVMFDKLGSATAEEYRLKVRFE